MFSACVLLEGVRLTTTSGYAVTYRDTPSCHDRAVRPEARLHEENLPLL